MASGWLESVKGKVAPLASKLGIGDEEAPAEQSLLQQVNEATTLDKTQRAIGGLFCCCWWPCGMRDWEGT